MKKYCDNCGITHTSLMCFNKPRRPIRKESEKTLDKRQTVSRLWFEINPPNSRGLWYCYLRISPDCPVKLTRTTIRLEHVKSKVRYPALKYDVSNLRPACNWCNKLKGSRDLDEIPEYVARNGGQHEIRLRPEDEETGIALVDSADSVRQPDDLLAVDE